MSRKGQQQQLHEALPPPSLLSHCQGDAVISSLLGQSTGHCTLLGSKHWHGAAKDSWFSHLAFGVQGKDTTTEWCEPVTDEEYDKLE